MSESVFFSENDAVEEEKDKIVNEVVKEINLLETDREWIQWSPIGDDNSIPVPPEVDPYDGPHRLMSQFSKSFETTLQCIYRTTAMDHNFFEGLL